MILARFAQWQGEYAAHGVPTFPVSEEKRPAVRGWQRVGMKGSEQLARKFPDANAFGFQCGERSGITVIDVDSANDAVHQEAIKRYGETPLICRTQSGGVHLYYRHAGECRSVRPDPDVPVDICGAGGYVVAPPSQGSKGAYGYIKGSLDDLDRLPTISIPVGQAEAISLVTRWVRANIGERNKLLWRYAMMQAPHVSKFDDLLDVAMTANGMDDTGSPLSDQEVMRLTMSAWRYEQEGRNWIGHTGGGSMIVPNPATRALLELRDGNAALLFMALRHQYKPSAIFPLAKSRAKALGIHRTTLARARDLLEGAGLIERVHQGGGGPHDPHLFRWTALARGRSG